MSASRDLQGILRGACSQTRCRCTSYYQLGSGSRCGSCQHLYSEHQALATKTTSRNTWGGGGGLRNCGLDGCTNPCYVEPSGKVHEFCCRSHGQEYHRGGSLATLNATLGVSNMGIHPDPTFAQPGTYVAMPPVSSMAAVLPPAPAHTGSTTTSTAAATGASGMTLPPPPLSSPTDPLSRPVVQPQFQGAAPAGTTTALADMQLPPPPLQRQASGAGLGQAPTGTRPRTGSGSTSTALTTTTSTHDAMVLPPAPTISPGSLQQQQLVQQQQQKQTPHELLVALNACDLSRLDGTQLRALDEQLDVFRRRVHEEIQQSATCVVCWTGSRQVLCVPCKHLCLCSNCSNKVTECPLCRTPIQQKMTVYT